MAACPIAEPRQIVVRANYLRSVCYGVADCAVLGCGRSSQSRATSTCASRTGLGTRRLRDTWVFAKDVKATQVGHWIRSVGWQWAWSGGPRGNKAGFLAPVCGACVHVDTQVTYDRRVSGVDRWGTMGFIMP